MYCLLTYMLCHVVEYIVHIMDLIQVEHNICKDHKGYTFMYYVLREGNPVGLVSAMSTYIY